MADLTIGRAGLGPTAPTLEVVECSWSGDVWQISGVIAASSADSDRVNSWKAVRQQLLGLTEGHERVVPVTWAQDSLMDGYYTVESSEVGVSPVILAEGHGPFSVSLRRIGTMRAPALEHRARMIDRPTDYTLTPITHTAYGVLGIPAAATDVTSEWMSRIGGSAALGDTGDIWRYAVDWAATTDSVVNRDYTASIPVADHYDSSCVVEAQYSAAWWPVVGRQAAATTGLTAIRMANGLIRVEPVATGVTVTTIIGGGLNTAKTFRLGWSGVVGTATTALRSVAVLRNGPEATTLRCIYSDNSSTPATVVVDLHLRRGVGVVSVAATRPGRSATTWVMSLATNEACSTVSLGGVTAGSIAASAGTHRPVLLCPHSNTQDLVNGRLTTSAAQAVARFGFGMATNVATAPDRQADIAYSYFAPIESTLLGVAR